ncbi:MAG: DUF1015 domain-containing protein [Christensenellaceae bacterium]|nr:DUF1015 domain-containing protein [Christensenellaceae bacterium]
MATSKNTGLAIPKILIPDEKVNMKKWAIIACDQYTSDRRYWEEVERTVGNSPSTLRMMLPEAYLELPDKQERIADTRETMYDYIEAGILKELPEGFILVERMIGGVPRKGLMVLVDLEEYEFDIAKKPLIRPTEQTVRDRIPPRMQIRMDAAVEMPHILAMIDDPDHTVIEPVWEKRHQLKKLYDFDLMMNGGKITGYFVDSYDMINGIMNAMAALPTHDGMKICVGDGNHSLATAKEIWNRAKMSLSEAELAVSPLRYALVELINLQDPALSILPIYRALFNVNPSNCIQYIVEKLNARGLGARLIFSRRKISPETMDPNTIYFESKDSMGRIELSRISGHLMLEDLQIVLEQFEKDHPASKLDYIHGDDTINELKTQYNTLCFILPALSKRRFMDTIVENGVLPKKCFSLGEADEKRFYLECRLLVLPDEEEEAPTEEVTESAPEAIEKEYEEYSEEEEEYEDIPEEQPAETIDDIVIEAPAEEVPVPASRMESLMIEAEEAPAPKPAASRRANEGLMIEEIPADAVLEDKITLGNIPAAPVFAGTVKDDLLLEELIDNIFED